MALPFAFASPVTLWIATGLGVASAAIAAWRGPAVPRGTLALAGCGIAFWVLAAGAPLWLRPSDVVVSVLVDLSPSTRTAAYRDVATLRRRVGELLPRGTSYHVEYFADGIVPAPATAATLPDVPVERTRFPVPDADAVLLFSDARFALPDAAPPVYPVIDPSLESPGDAAVVRVDSAGDMVAAALENRGAPRAVQFRGAVDPSAATAPAGPTVLTRRRDPAAAEISVQLAPGDAWPENDALSAPRPPPERLERWWVGSRDAGDGWRAKAPRSLPDDPAAYFAAGVVLLDDVAAPDLSDAQQACLTRYVRELGGALVIGGGPDAFAAGGYAGAPLEALSPLASSPPEPATHWMLLVDGSGSMAAGAGGGAGEATRWQVACDALVRLVPRLPPADAVSVGSFAESLTWWVSGARPADAARVALPPAGAAPRGPTNLDAALRAIAAAATGLTRQVLLLTDADARVDDPAGLVAAFNAKRVRLHVLAIGDGVGLPALRAIAAATGGSVLTRLEPRSWAEGARSLMRSASPKLLNDEPASVRFVSELANLPAQTVAPWNRTWLKQSAEGLAKGTAAGGDVPMSARWRAGEGQVAAVAFGVDPATAEAVARLVARGPRDPRFRVTWHAGPELRVVIDAVDAGRYLNGLRPLLEVAGADSVGAPVASPVPQVGPGRYELSVPAPRRPSFAAVRVDGAAVDRVAVAGRYAPEFDATGNDRAAMAGLAHRTGGEVIPPGRRTPIDLRRPPRVVPLTSVVAAAGAACIALGLAWWRKAR